jgi:hypothetical protein
MFLLYGLAFIFAFVGLLLLVVGFLSDAELGTKKWGMLCLIASAITCLLKRYLDNPEPVNNFFRSIFSQ